jgi:hypothetical protein
MPVLETLHIMIGAASAGKNERQQDEADDDNDLETRKPELKLAKEADAEVVDADDDNQEDGDPDSGIHLLSRTPVLDNQGSGSELVRRDNDILEPISVPLGIKVSV